MLPSCVVFGTMFLSIKVFMLYVVFLICTTNVKGPSPEGIVWTYQANHVTAMYKIMFSCENNFHRLWTMLVNGWELEIDVSTLHVPC